MGIFTERPERYSMGDVQFDYASRRWYVVLAASRAVRDFAASLSVVAATASAYSYVYLYFGKVRTQSQSEAIEARELVDDLLDRYVRADPFLCFIETLDMSGLEFDIDEEIRNSGWEGEHRESDDRDDDDWMPF